MDGPRRSSSLCGVGVWAIDSNGDRPKGFAYCDSTSSMGFGAGRVSLATPFRFTAGPDEGAYSILLPFRETSNATTAYGEIHTKSCDGALRMLDVRLPQTLRTELGESAPAGDFFLWGQVGEKDQDVWQHVALCVDLVEMCCERVSNRFSQDTSALCPMNPRDFAGVLLGLDCEELLDEVPAAKREKLQQFCKRVAEASETVEKMGPYLFECKSTIGSYLTENLYNPYLQIHLFVDIFKSGCVGKLTA